MTRVSVSHPRLRLELRANAAIFEHYYMEFVIKNKIQVDNVKLQINTVA